MTHPVRRLVLGGPFGAEPLEASAERLAHFASVGGRLVESARSYRAGAAEAAIGAWMRENPGTLGVITKVGHDPEGRDIPLTRAAVRSGVRASLACLGIDVIDTLILHCDDPDREVGEIAETLVGLIDAGHTKRIGASNWPAHRLSELADTVTPHVLVASYHFSLAAPDPVALRSLPADPGVLRVIAAKDLPILSWSAQAHGYFARGLTTGDDPFDTDLSRTRRGRCQKLAEELGCTPETVALAWTLHHPGVSASIGPRTPEQLTRSLDALSLSLTNEQVRWLQQ